ncbi:MAG: glycoside hydrolase family 92 protein [Bacteroidales bacterium]|nr:glycoside hydrolase family 92 protein [Bacteroidales bacterium]
MKLLPIKALVFAALTLFVACCETGPVDKVNPNMGGISMVTVPAWPTVSLPAGMLRTYPDRADFAAATMAGFPLNYVNHRGEVSFRLSPFCGQDSLRQKPCSFTYDREEITPYSYDVVLDEEDIALHFAPSSQSGLFEVDYRDVSEDGVTLAVSTCRGTLQDTSEGIGGEFRLINSPTAQFVYLETSPSPSKTIICGSEAKLFFDGKPNVSLRYGISYISVEQAEANLRREIHDWNMAKLRKDGRKAWNEALGKIKVYGGTPEDQEVFYTSLYRILERPVCVSEDGKYYSPYDNQVHSDEGVPMYTDDWIWDTFRGAHPLRILTEPEMEAAILTSYIRMAQQSEEGWLPNFPGTDGDSHRMNGNHVVASFADAAAKSLPDVDYDAAYDLSKLTLTEKSLLPWTKVPLTELDQFYFDNGWYPALPEGEKETCPQVHSFENRQAVAIQLAYAYDSWCALQLASRTDNTEDSEYFSKHAADWKNVYNPETGFMHPRSDSGEFMKPFDYIFSGGQGARAYYTENNAWTYRWAVPHDIPGLIETMGGPEKFEKNLDEMFRTPLGRSKYNFFYQLPDQTGNTGQFSMGNEPGMMIPYLYNYTGSPWKTQKTVRKMLQNWFRSDLQGVPGDEDGGGLSSFVVFSMLGFYPVTPGLPEYEIGSPVFEKAVVCLGNGRKLVISARNAPYKYIESVTINGKPVEGHSISHESIASGGKLNFVMTDKPDKTK